MPLVVLNVGAMDGVGRVVRAECTVGVGVAGGLDCSDVRGWGG